MWRVLINCELCILTLQCCSDTHSSEDKNCSIYTTATMIMIIMMMMMMMMMMMVVVSTIIRTAPDSSGTYKAVIIQ